MLLKAHNKSSGLKGHVVHVMGPAVLQREVSPACGLSRMARRRGGGPGVFQGTAWPERASQEDFHCAPSYAFSMWQLRLYYLFKTWMIWGGEKAIMQEFSFTCGDSFAHGYKCMGMEKSCCNELWKRTVRSKCGQMSNFSESRWSSFMQLNFFKTKTWGEMLQI